MKSSTLKISIFYLFTLFIFLIVVPIFLWLIYIISFPPKIQIQSVQSATSLKSVISKFKSGDLLFFSGNHIVEKAIKTCQGGPFSHVGIVIFFGKIPHILEVDNHPKKLKRGVHLITLSEKLQLCSKGRDVNYFEWSSITTSKNIDYNRVQELLTPYKDYERDLTFFSWLGIFERREKKKSIFCSELIVIILEKLNLVNLLHSPEWYSPQNLRDFAGIVLAPDTWWTNQGLVTF